MATSQDDQRKNISITNQKHIYDVRSYIRFFRSLKTQRNLNYLPIIYQNEVMHPSIAYLPRVCGIYPGKLLWSGINKIRSPIFCCKWLRDSIHLVTGSSNGEISLWNPLKMIQEVNFQAHECAIRAITVSHDGNWLVTADHNGYIKYWQSNLNLVTTFSANPEPIRDLSFSPTDQKFASCGDDGLIKIWDYDTCKCEQTLQGHGTDVKCLDWNYYSRLIVSGSKDCQQPIMLWDPRNSSPLCTIHIHKNAIMAIKWSSSGNMFATASKDKTVKVFDIRAMKELQTFRGHQKEVYNVAWHSISEKLISSGSGEGTMIHWHLGNDRELGITDNAHDGVVWEMVWHPEGHLLASVSNDHSCKLWGRNDFQSLPALNQSSEANNEPQIGKEDITDIFMDPIHKISNTEEEGTQKYLDINYQVRSKYFQCYIESRDDESIIKNQNSIPVVKITLSKIPTREDNQLDEKYIYDDYVPFRTPTSPKYIDVIDEDEKFTGKVKFPKIPVLINRMPQSVLDHIKMVTSKMPRLRCPSSPLISKRKNTKQETELNPDTKINLDPSFLKESNLEID